MELLVILKNPVLALGSRTVRMLMELGRIALFFSNGFILLFFPPLQISKIKQQIRFWRRLGNPQFMSFKNSSLNILPTASLLLTNQGYLIFY